MSLLIKLCRRELLIQMRQIRYLFNSCLFLFIFLLLFPLTLKPDITLLRLVIPGLVWMGILLMMLFSAERLFQQDYEQGVIEQWLISGFSLPLMVGAKLFAHGLLNLLPLLLLCPVVALLFSLTVHEMFVLAATMICATPALLSLCALVAALGVGIQQRAVLMALIVLPFTLPLLVFGSGTLTMAMQGFAVLGNLALLLALSLLAMTFLPFAIAAVIRASHAQ